MNDPRRDILAAVARGELTPEEGATRLEEVTALPPGPATAALPPPADPAGTPRLRTIKVDRSLGTAEIVGDPNVREAVADGPHVAVREGDTLVIRGASVDGDDEGEGATFRFRRGGVQVRATRHARFAFGGDADPLRVRMNPELALDAQTRAGSLQIRDVHGPIRAHAQAGTVTIDGFRAPLDLSVQAGSLRASGVLASGLSKIRCDAGSVRLNLEKGSSVRVRARSTLGEIHLGDTDSISLDGAQDLMIGAGEATLEVNATMGSVRITTDS